MDMNFSAFDNVEVTDETAAEVAGIVTAIATVALAGTGFGAAAPLIGLGVKLGMKLCDGNYDCPELPALKAKLAAFDALPPLTT
ncbi:hypothetical protein [Maridesulfovibrio ferrireducens]|uniref:hypothetical protein n=1 Tax=Maridesulfovibrio ferrireducens TaxID=246191 RepID=UPI001A1A846B|nr:hypothetical protein [Maridesulfovibrio ferrireducens]MBI9110277.1 hypothetical protein [Maridesulfovibrio ferrireducens]